MNTQDCIEEIKAKSTIKWCPSYPVYCRIQFDHEPSRCHSEMRQYYQSTIGSYLCSGCEEIVTGTYREFYQCHLSHLGEFKFQKKSILSRKKRQSVKLAKALEVLKVQAQDTENLEFKVPKVKVKRAERGTGTADRGAFQDKVASPHPCGSRKRPGVTDVFPIFEKKIKNLERTLLPKKVLADDGFSLDCANEDDAVQDVAHEERSIKNGEMQDVEDPAETRTAINVIEDLMAKCQNGRSFNVGGVDVDARNYASFCAPVVKKLYVAPVKSINRPVHTPIQISDDNDEGSPTYVNEVENDSFLEGSVVDSMDFDMSNEKKDEQENDEKLDEQEDEKKDDEDYGKVDEQEDEKLDEKKDDADYEKVDESSKTEDMVTMAAPLDCYDSLAVLIANVLGQEKSLTSLTVRKNLKEAFTGDEAQCQQIQKVIVKALDDVIVVKEMELKGIRNLRAAAVLIGKVMRDRRATENLVTENMKALYDVLRK